jgi:choline kinase
MRGRLSHLLAVKGILIAAGLGSRLGPHTAELPKCLLQVGEKTMLEHQIAAMRACGLKEIVVINGYRAERFPDLGVTYVTNPRFRENNILNSLMCAQEHMAEGFVASYSDLVYEPRLVQGLLEASGQIAISVDDTWKERYAHLEFHPPEAVEKVAYDQDYRVHQLGKAISNEAPGEFIGLLRCSAQAAPGFLQAFARARAQFWGRPFVRAADFEKAYLTDFLQYLVDDGTVIQAAVAREERWVEVDTAEDLELARRTFASPLEQP